MNRLSTLVQPNRRVGIVTLGVIAGVIAGLVVLGLVGAAGIVRHDCDSADALIGVQPLTVRTLAVENMTVEPCGRDHGPDGSSQTKWRAWADVTNNGDVARAVTLDVKMRTDNGQFRGVYRGPNDDLEKGHSLRRVRVDFRVGTGLKPRSLDFLIDGQVVGSTALGPPVEP
jgi:hypothetical protein